NQRRAEEEARQAEVARRQAEEEARRRAEEAAHKAEESRLQQHRAEQEGYRQQMVVLCEQALKKFESIASYITWAERDLDQAETDFAEGVFVPFWNSVRKAVQWLGWFHSEIGQLKDNLARYTELTTKCETAPPAFSLHVQAAAKLAVGIATAE